MSDLMIGDDDFDLEQLLNDPDFLNDVNSLDDLPGPVSDPGQDQDPKKKLDEIEQMLMNDEFDEDESKGLLFDVLLDSPVNSDADVFDSPVNSEADVLLDSPVNSEASPRGEVVNGFDSKASSPEVENGCKDAYDGEGDFSKKRNKESEDGEEGEDDDPLTKKRKRQERNRDAAVRSRERRKLYVKDLEMKSRYFEGECKRLGMLLNCVVAENQALRLSLHSTKAFGASMTKQESAVLLLESLLLGSLLWFLGIMCLLILPDPLRLTKEEVPLENVDNQNRGSLAPRKAGRKIVEHGVHRSFMLSKTCKASRSRMRINYFVLEVLA
ncbi:BZIP domain-containing protein [Heracleum sosnowskyi]|uniref:BZIP domain-containing protein n=1 Tax=Heracleum sosnowskyi TaxID=360622 RepID=A0AAD8J999_9APIA|nr:BZIP domain-containing protein [Heracleum sosnowskyi]